MFAEGKMFTEAQKKKISTRLREGGGDSNGFLVRRGRRYKKD